MLELILELWFVSLKICVGFSLGSGQYPHFPSPLEFEWESSVCSYIVLVSMASYSDVHKREEIVIASLFFIFIFYFIFCTTHLLCHFISSYSVVFVGHSSIGNCLP